VKCWTVAEIDVEAVVCRSGNGRSRRLAAFNLIARSANAQNSVESLPFDDNSFDKALAINSMQYWPQAVAGLPLGPQQRDLMGAHLSQNTAEDERHRRSAANSGGWDC
jgi:hypothetical protein